jgi:D-amino-acid dehydrogenase
MRRDSPLRFEPRMDWRQWRWCLQFVRACTAAQSELTTRRMLQLSFYSRALMQQAVAAERLDFNYRQNGKLIVHTEAQSFDAARRLLDYQQSLGCEQEALDAAACVALEPALEHMRSRIVGGIHTPGEDAGDCYRFCLGLEQRLRCTEPPAEFLFNTEIQRILHWQQRILGVQTSAGVLEADFYVLALGTQSAELVRPLGLDLPVYPLKGYSLTLPVRGENTAPRISITDYKKKIVYARLGDELRVAGMADLAGYEARLDAGRVAVLLEQVRASFPGASDYSSIRPWCGLRPATPKGTPLIGPTRYPQLLLDTGHGALGFTLAMGCGRVIADFVAGRKPQIALDGFLPD